MQCHNKTVRQLQGLWPCGTAPLYCAHCIQAHCLLKVTCYMYFTLVDSSFSEFHSEVFFVSNAFIIATEQCYMAQKVPSLIQV